MIEEKAYGKINLALRIVKKRPDGYHEIDMVFQSIELHDTVTLEEADSLQLSCSDAALPCDASNLAWKAALALQEYAGIRKGAAIHLEKRLPLAAGLAGGSADGAAVLRGLKTLWGLDISVRELQEIGTSLGADVPFCIGGGTCRGRGIGELLEPLVPLPSWPVLIVHPGLAVHTGKAYSLFDDGKVRRTVDVEAMVQAVGKGDFAAVQQSLGNTFEELVFPFYPALPAYCQVLQEAGLTPLMSGSGPTIFALVPPDQDGLALYEELQTRMEGAEVLLSRLHQSW